MAAGSVLALAGPETLPVVICIRSWRSGLVKAVFGLGSKLV